jgi:hypothetical protein
MMEPIQFATRLVLVPQSKMYDPLSSWAALSELEMQANMAELRALQSIERRNRFVLCMVDCWPIAAGLILGALAPAMQAMLVVSAPWAMNIVFPFVVLAGRPELHLNGTLAHYLPLIMLYAQFPLDGLIARKVLKRHIKISGVAMQVLFYHFLGAMEILLISGAIRQFFLR